MTRGRLSLAVFISILTVPHFASADTTAVFKVLIDADNSAATGCVIATPTAVAGIDQVLTTTVNLTATTATVVKVERQECVGGSLLSPVTVDATGWPAGTNAAGRTVIETHLPLAALGASVPPSMRLAFVGTIGPVSTAIVARGDGSAIVFPPLEEGRRHAVVPAGPARTIVLDGNDADWTGLEPLGSSGTGGSAALALDNVYAFAGPHDLFFYFQASIGPGVPIAVDDTYTVRRGQSIVVAAPGVLANDSDPAGDPLSASLVTPPLFGTVLLAGSGGFSYNQNGTAAATDTFQYAAANATASSAPATVTIHITPDAPPTGRPDAYSVARGMTINIPAPGVLANDSDPDNDPLTASVAVQPSHGSLTLHSNGGFTYAHDDSNTTSDSFSYRAFDGVLSSGPVGVTLTILPRNHAPSFTAGPDQTVIDSAGAQSVPNWATAISAGPADEAGQTLNFVATNDNNSLFTAQPAISPTGTLTFTPAPGQTGDAHVTVVLHDNGGTANGGVDASAPAVFAIHVDKIPVITSAVAASFQTGVPGSFAVTASARPPADITESGALPAGVSFVNNGPPSSSSGTLSGTPAAGTGGVYSISFTGTNVHGSGAAQAFTLTVNQPPAITSANAAVFATGIAGSFAITSSGFPTAVALTESGALPPGMTFVSNGNGTATLGGTPAAGSGGVYAVTIGGSNGVAPAASQSLTLTIDEPAAFTSASAAAFTAGQPGSFTIRTSGFPVAAITSAGALPAGLTFTDNGNGTATLAGTPAAVTGGTYVVTFTANNGIGAPATQNFTVTVGQPPAITSANAVAFTAGMAGTFTVSTTGFPAAVALSENGALPAGVTFVDNGNGTATLTGTPAAGSGGVDPLTITANNGVAPSASQNFTLTVDEAPAITSANNATFTVGASSSFTISTTGFPAPAIARAGATLPSGVTFTDNGNGTATLAGTPAASTGGTYAISLTASNGIGSSAVQSFTLRVDQAPAITSANSATFTAGTAGTTFTVAASGYPAPAVSLTGGTLPAGLSFDAASGLISGTPNAGTGKTYALQFTASNGTGAAAVQNFTLVVDEAPSLLSANSTTFTAGQAGSFTFTTSGYPLPSIVESGPLPAGVTFTSNHDGTATLSGAPTVTGAFAITITATNGVGAAATQNFTVSVACPTISVANPSATAGVAGSPMTGTFGASGGIGTTTFLIISGTLPNGLTLGTNGSLSGTPLQTGSFAITVRATDSNGCSGVGATYNLTISCPVINVSVPSVTTAVAGTSFSQSFGETGGVGAVGFTLAGGTLPAGLTLASSGTLSGTPTQTGAFTITVRATDANGCAGLSAAYTVTVGCPTINVSAPAILSGPAGTAYSQSFTQTGAVGSATFTVTSGALPVGLTLQANGAFSGTPTQAGSFPLTVQVKDANNCTGSVSTTLTIAPGAAAQLVFSTAPTSTTAGQAIAPAVAVQIDDAYGNVTTSTANVTLAIGNNAGGGTLSGTTTAAASSGVATFANLSINKSGTGYTLSASAAGLTGATSSAFDIRAAAPASLAFSTQPSNATAGVAIAPAVRVAIFDAFGNAATTATNSITVAIGTNAGGGSLSGTSAVAAVAGVATFSNLSIDKAGAGYTLTAGATGLSGATSGTFTISAAALDHFLVEAAGGGTIAGQTAGVPFNIQLTAKDAFGNTVTSFTGTTDITSNGTLSSGTTTAAFTAGVLASHAVTLTSAGSATLTATRSGGTESGTSSTFTVGPGAAAKLVFSTSPSSTAAGQAIAPAVAVAIEDAFGNATTSTASVTLAIGNNSGGGTLSGTTTAAASSGVATFANVSINKSGTGYTLIANSAGLTGATSGAFDISPAAPASLAFSTQPSNATAGVAIAPAVRVALFDAFGNATTTATNSITVAIGTNAGGGSLTGTTTVAAVAGVATFSNLSIDKAGAGYTLTASAAGLSGATSGTFTISAAALDHFLVEAAGGGAIGTQTAGVAFNIQLTAKDAFGNTVTSFAGTTDITSSGTLSSGTTTAAFTAGVLASHAVTLTSAGSTTLTATRSGGTESGTSNAFTIAPASLNHFAITAAGGGAIANEAVNVPFAIAITAVDQFGNTATSFTGTADITSSTGTLSAGGGTTSAFSAGVLSSHSVTFSSTGSNTVTATRTGGAETATSSAFTVFAPPVANNDSYQAGMNLVLTVAAPAGVLANDTGSGSLASYGINGSEQSSFSTPTPTAQGGTIAIAADGSFTYTPPSGFSGTDSFKYTIANVAGSSVGTVTITIQPLPVAVGDAYNAAQNTVRNVPNPGVLSNDTLNSASIASYGASTGSEQTTIGASTATAHGNVALNADGSFAYTPAAGYTGTDSFKYKLTNLAGSSTATVTMTVVAVPVAVADSYIAPKDEVYSSSSAVTSNDTLNSATIVSYGVLGTEQTVIGTSTPTSHGTVALNADGTFTYTPSSGYTGADAFKYTLSNYAGSAVGTVSITVDARPSVSGVTPVDSNTNVTRSSPIAVTFSEAVTLTSGAIVLQCPSGTPVTLNAPVSSSGGTVWTAQPAAALPPSTVCVASVLASGVTDIDGNLHPAANYAQTNGFTTMGALAVNSTSPADGATSIALNSSISVSFNQAADPSTITTNTANTSCSGSLQVSADGFSTCVQMTASPAAGLGNTAFLVTPSAPLAGSTTYRVRVTTAAHDSTGLPLPATYTQPAGFTTKAALAISSTSPADGASAVALNATISLTFNRSADATTVTTNTANTSCSGSLQVSADGFATCVQMSGLPAVSNGNATYTLTPATLLGGSMTYKVRVTTAAQDSDGVALASAFTQSTGFTTQPAIAISSTSPADGATAVSTSTAIAVTFNVAATPSSVTTNAGSTSCSGTLQVSSDNFTTCVSMTAAPVASGGDTIFTVTPAPPALSQSATYKIRVTTGVLDSSGVALASQYTQTTGFTGNQPPTITSLNKATFETGQSGMFPVTATGVPSGGSIVFSESPVLPWLTFVDNHDGTATLSGTPDPGTGGSYQLTITANNGVTPNATQNFTLTVNQAPAITSASSTTFAPGKTGQTFAVATTGYPINAITRTGTLPSGVTFTDNGNNGATIGGVPASGTAGTYSWTITATNSVSTATQTFTFNVTCPTITASGTASFSLTYGTSMGTSTYSETGGNGTVTWSATNLPTGLSIGSSTGVLSGTPTQTGSFTATIKATDAGGCIGTQSVSITVDPSLSTHTYTTVGNTQLAAGTTTTTPSVSANALSAGDSADVSITYAVVTGPTHGTLALNSTGSFTYTPTAANSTPDSFTYSGTANGRSVQRTANISFSGMVWYVDNTFVGTHDGRSNTPFTDLSSVGTPATANGDYIYVARGSGPTTGSYTMKTSQRLIGAGSTLSVPSSSPILTVTGASANAPTLSGTLTLASSVTVSGISMNTSALTALSGSSINGVNVTINSIITTTGTAVSITGAGNGSTTANSMTFTSISANGATNGINLQSYTGTFTVNGDGVSTSAGSGGTIQATTGSGILVNGPTTLSLNRMIVSMGAQDQNGIEITGTSSLTLNYCTISHSVSLSTNSTKDGISLTNLTGSASITHCTVTGSPLNGIEFHNTNTNMSAGLTVSNTTVSNNNSTFGNDGLLFIADGTSNIASVMVDTDTFSSLATTGVQAQTDNTAVVSSFTIQHSNFTSNNLGIDLDQNTSSSFTFTVTGNTLTSHKSDAISVFSATTSTLSGRFTGKISANTIGTSGVRDSGSAVGVGIRVAVDGVTAGVFTINGNHVYEVPNGYGMQLITDGGSSASGKFKVTSNDINRPSGTNQTVCGGSPCPLSSIRLLADKGAQGCLVLTGNSAYDPTSWPAGGGSAYDLKAGTNTPGGAVLKLEGNTSNSASTNVTTNNTVQNSTNSPVTTTNVTVVSTGTCGSGFP